jgi:hypothetical protein
MPKCGQKTKTKKQIGKLLSGKKGVSPLTAAEKSKLKRELHSGKVKVVSRGKRKSKKAK